MNNPEEILKKLVAGEIDEIDGMGNRRLQMIVEGKRIPNKVLRQTVDKLKAKNMSTENILANILKFDELAEKGQLIDYLNQKKQKNTQTN